MDPFFGGDKHNIIPWDYGFPGSTTCQVGRLVLPDLWGLKKTGGKRYMFLMGRFDGYFCVNFGWMFLVFFWWVIFIQDDDDDDDDDDYYYYYYYILLLLLLLLLLYIIIIIIIIIIFFHIYFIIVVLFSWIGGWDLWILLLMCVQDPWEVTEHWTISWLTIQG